MKKQPEGQPKLSLLATGLLAVFFVLDFILAVVGGKPRWVVSRSFAGVTVCTSVFLFLLYQRLKNRR